MGAACRGFGRLRRCGRGRVRLPLESSSGAGWVSGQPLSVTAARGACAVPRGGRPASPPLVSRRRPSGPLWAGSSGWCRPGPQRPSLGERTGSGPAGGAESPPGAASGPLLRREPLLAPKLPHRGGPRALWGPQAVV